MVLTSERFAGRFLVGPLLGQGGMSDVYRAVDEQTGTEIALKIVRSGDPELARRLTQEVTVHARMVHPGLIRLLDTGVHDGQAYLVMELIEGVTLATSLRAEPLSARLTAKLGAILGEALAYVHAEGIVHRDVKPSNILLGADGRALLGDFGIARLLDGATFTLDGTTLGTVAYMAPEQLEDHQVGPSADIWSLGMVLLECLTGRRIYEGTSSEIIARRLAGPVPLPADLPVPWKLLLSGMLDHRPEQRLDGGQVAALLSTPIFAVPWVPAPTSATETMRATQPLDLTALAPGRQFAAATADATAVRPPLAPTGPPPAGRTQPAGLRDRRRWIIAAVIVALCLIGGGVAYALSGTTPHTPVAPPTTTTTTTVPPTTTTSSTTTTTIPTAPTALAALVRDIASGVDGGSIGPGIGQALSTQAQQAVSDEAAGQPQRAAQDLQQAASTIANAEQNGNLAPAEASVLQTDLSALAGTLGLSAAGAPPTTTTTTTTVPTPGGPLGGGGHKHGPGG